MRKGALLFVAAIGGGLIYALTRKKAEKIATITISALPEFTTEGLAESANIIVTNKSTKTGIDIPAVFTIKANIVSEGIEQQLRTWIQGFIPNETRTFIYTIIAPIILQTTSIDIWGRVYDPAGVLVAEAKKSMSVRPGISEYRAVVTVA